MTADNPLARLHTQVLAALGEASAAERKSDAAGRSIEATYHRARADAFDWALQRIDEEQEKTRDA